MSDILQGGTLAASLAGGSDTPDNRTNGVTCASLSEKTFPAVDWTATGQAPPLAYEPDILDRFMDDIRLAGVAGEDRLARLTYLALTSRLLPWGKATNRPVSVIAKGTSSTGKSHTTQTVLRFFPPTAYLDLGSMSKRYLLYADENLSHRFLVIPEASSIAGDDELLTVIRTLLSEGRVSHGTVDGDSKRTARRIDKDGPTGLLVTTTAAFMDSELETRCLSLTTDDTPEQTRRVYEVLADLEEEEVTPVDFRSWRDLQTWLAESGETRVTIPYIRALARLMPAGATRLRRDFVSLLCLLRAHAILHQATREHDGGRIVASLDDYVAVRALVAELVAQSADAGASDATRQTVAAVRRAQEGNHGEHASAKAVIDQMGVGRSAGYDRIRNALSAGYIVNEAKKDERGHKLVAGAALPGEDDFLPTLEAVRAASGQELDTASPYVERDSDALSGCPSGPADGWGQNR
jgi:hypothetical protein